MALTLHPAAAKAINEKALDILSRIERLDDLSRLKLTPDFPTEIPTAANFTHKDIIGELEFELKEAGEVIALQFIHRDGAPYGLRIDALLLLSKLVGEVLKINWAQECLSKTFIRKNVINWCRDSFRAEPRVELSQRLIDQSEKAIAKYTLWAPIANLEVQSPFKFGPVQILPMTKALFDDLEKQLIGNDSRQADNAKAAVGKIREDMQGCAAVVVQVEAEPAYVREKGLELAADVVGLLRFLSPASLLFGMACSIGLLGTEYIPQDRGLLFEVDGSFFSAFAKNRPANISIDRLSTADVRGGSEDIGFSELANLVSAASLNEFQTRLRASLLTFTKGITFTDAADRLVYTCSALEALLLKDASEPIQQNLGERMAFLIADDVDRRQKIVRNVRDVYHMRSQYIHHRISELEEAKLRTFGENAHSVFLVALKGAQYETPSEFTDAIDHRKLGG